MRYVAVYRPVDPARAARGLREFLYVEALGKAEVWEHAASNPPDAGWTLHDVRPACSDVEYLEVPKS